MACQLCGRTDTKIFTMDNITAKVELCPIHITWIHFKTLKWLIGMEE